MAVLLVEKSAYEVDLQETVSLEAAKQGKKKTIRTATEHPKSQDKNYATSHGVLRGAYGGTSDEIPTRVKVPLDMASMDEGLHSLVQELTCRRMVLTAVYENDKPSKQSLMFSKNGQKLTNISKILRFPVATYVADHSLIKLDQVLHRKILAKSLVLHQVWLIKS